MNTARRAAEAERFLFLRMIPHCHLQQEQQININMSIFLRSKKERLKWSWFLLQASIKHASHPHVLLAWAAFRCHEINRLSTCTTEVCRVLLRLLEYRNSGERQAKEQWYSGNYSYLLIKLVWRVFFIETLWLKVSQNQVTCLLPPYRHTEIHIYKNRSHLAHTWFKT